MQHARLKSVTILLTWLCLVSVCGADVRLPAIISDNMVLQKDQPLPIWGWAAPDEEVTVRLANQVVTAKANGAGRWRVTLNAIPNVAGPLEMIVKGKNEVKVSNILVGEVWLGSGQSNMQWSVQQSADSATEVRNAKFPKIRLFIVPLTNSGIPVGDVNARWVECSPETVGPSSATLYFFGREIHQKLNLPVGLITSAWGGTRIQPWIPPKGFAAIPELEAENQKMFEALNSYSQALLGYNEIPPPATSPMKPAATAPVGLLPRHPLDSNFHSTGLYNSMIHPLVPFGIRGCVWYQGETNVKDGSAYLPLQQGLIEGWRQVWNQEGNRDFPFFYAQLTPFNYGSQLGGKLPELWEAQTASMAVNNTGMAVLTDVGKVNDIHPPNKQEVGSRLSLWALAKTYGKSNLIYSGPLFQEIKVEPGQIRVQFQHATGLKSRDGKDLTWWSISGADKHFVQAQAQIEGDTVVVSAASVTRPVAVRFGWHQLAEPNLVNGAGLPASPFRSDKWTDAVSFSP